MGVSAYLPKLYTYTLCGKTLVKKPALTTPAIFSLHDADEWWEGEYIMTLELGFNV